MERTFTRTDTKVVKGVAVLLMLMHHLFYFSDHWPDTMPAAHKTLPNFMGGQGLEQMLGIFGVICVPIFFFLAGYGLWQQTQRRDFRLGNRILLVYKQYWKVFVIFIPIGFLLFRHQDDYCAASYICHVFENHGLTDMLAALFCLKTPYNYEWWFLQGYVIFLTLGYIYLHLTAKVHNFWGELAAVLSINFYGRTLLTFLLDNAVLPQEGPFLGIICGHWNGALLFVGIVFAKYHVFDSWIQRSVQKYTAVSVVAFAIVIIASTFFFQLGEMSVKYDAILVPVFIVAVVALLRNLPPLYKALGFVGRYSTSMWLIHTFYLYYYGPVAKLTHISGNLWLDYVILVVLSLVSSMALEWFWKSMPVEKLQGLFLKKEVVVV